MMASEKLEPTLPSSGGPDARNDDADEADKGFAECDERGGNQQHVYELDRLTRAESN
jgi:hypothetical protein